MSAQLRSLLGRAVDHLDVTMAWLGCILAIPLTIYLQAAMRSPLLVLVGIIVFFTCLAYLLIRRRRSALVQTHTEAPPRAYLLLNILFFALLTYSILAFHLRPEFYTRPMVYFIATVAMAALLAVEILFLPSRRSAVPFTLFKIVVISLSLGWSHLLLYPGIVGTDPWHHQMFAGKILEAGYIPSGYHYSEMPVMHLLSGATSLVTGLNYKLATMFSVSLLQVVCTALFIFLLGKFIHSTRTGLLAALLLVIAGVVIEYTQKPIPNSLGTVLIPVVVYLLFKLRQERPATAVCLSVLLMVALILTHAIAAVMLAAVLALIWLGAAVHRRLRYRTAAGFRIFLVAALLFTGTSFTYWTLVSGWTPYLNWLGREFTDRLVDGPHPPAVVDPPPTDLPPLSAALTHYLDHVIPFGERLFTQLGHFLFFALAVFGSLALLSRSLRNTYGFVLVGVGLMVLAITFLGISIDFFALGRFNYLAHILLAVPVGIALLWLAGWSRSRMTGTLITGMMVLALAFLMAVGPAANNDNRTLAPHITVSYGFTPSEMEAANTAARIHDGYIAGDRNYRNLGFLPEFEGRMANICDQIYYRDFTEIQDKLVLIREDIVVNPMKIHGFSPFRLDYDPRDALSEQGFSRVYDSGSVSGFVS